MKTRVPEDLSFLKGSEGSHRALDILPAHRSFTVGQDEIPGILYRESRLLCFFADGFTLTTGEDAGRR